MKIGRPIALGVTVAALAVGGTAIAAPGGPGGGLLGGEDRTAELAEDLAGELEGVSPNQVEQALDSVREQRGEEHRQQMAEAIVANLDGVNADEVAAALERHHEQIEQAREQGEVPERGDLVATLAEDLGKSEDEIQQALEAAHEERASAHREEAEQRIDEAVEQGRITEEQADQLRGRLENGPKGPRGFGPGPGGPPEGAGGPPGGPGAGAFGPGPVQPESASV